jgi:hypothetical protein
MAQKYNRFPWELKQAPAREFFKMLEIERLKDWAANVG